MRPITRLPKTPLEGCEAMFLHSRHSDLGSFTTTSRQQRYVSPLAGLMTITLSLCLSCPTPSHAEVRVVTATGEHRMTDRETKTDAIRLATEQAKKQALEQVASYLESVTVVRDLDVTQDEIRSYTAGMVLVLDQQADTRLDGDVVVIRVTLKAQVDSDEAAQAITALKQNEDVRQELVALKEDVDQLHQQLEEANQALARATSPGQARQLNQQRNDLLNQAESDAMVAQAWTDWVLVAPFAQPYPSAGLVQVQGLLGLAGRLNPNNPHLAFAQQTVGAKSPPAPPQPRQPPVPHTVPFLPGYYVVPQQPGNTTTIIQVHPQPGTSPSHSGRNMMPTYRQVPAPNNPPNQPTLHTYRAGGDTLPPSEPQSPAAATRRIRPAVIRQTQPAPSPGPAPESGSTHSSNQGGK